MNEYWKRRGASVHKEAMRRLGVSSPFDITDEQRHIVVGKILAGRERWKLLERKGLSETLVANARNLIEDGEGEGR